MLEKLVGYNQKKIVDECDSYVSITVFVWERCTNWGPTECVDKEFE